MKNILSEMFPTGYGKVTDLERVGNTNFLYGGLNIVYGLEGSGKSWQIVASDFGDNEVIYLDTDGSNGTLFAKHCEDHDVHYIDSSTIMDLNKAFIDNYNEQRDKNFVHGQLTTFQKVFILLVSLVDNYRYKNHKSYMNKKLSKPVFIMDSFSSMSEGAKINNSEDISNMLYPFNHVAERLGICLILIDHATRNSERDHGFKLEGNEGGKKRTTVTVNKYLPTYPNEPELGGSFLCERARGNLSGLKIGDSANVSSVNISNALAWLEKRYPKALDDEISKTDFTKKTRNEKDKWVRAFEGELFNKKSEGEGIRKKVMLSIKEELI